MANKPKASDYAAGAAEKAHASIAMAEMQRFNTTYKPLLTKMRDRNIQNQVGRINQNRAAADTAQALGNSIDPASAESPEAGKAFAEGLAGQSMQAAMQTLGADNAQKAGVLAAARGEANTAQAGLAQAARIETSNRLEAASRHNAERGARQGAALKMAGAFVGRGMQNMDEGRNFFDRGRLVENPDGTLYRKASGSFSEGVGNAFRGARNAVFGRKETPQNYSGIVRRGSGADYSNHI